MDLVTRSVSAMKGIDREKLAKNFDDLLCDKKLKITQFGTPIRKKFLGRYYDIHYVCT
jgi:hypothetical protein